MTTLVVIPARWGSTRFPGKPLALLAGRTLIARSIDLARRATRGRDAVEIVVATDDGRIAEAASLANCAVVMTDPAIASGSGRALAAATAWPTQVARVLNLQGDTPLLPAVAVEAVLAGMDEHPDADCVTPVVQLTWPGLDALRDAKRSEPFSGTSCIRGSDGRAIWFSKQIMPAIRDEPARRDREPLSPVFRHLGLYGFSLAALQRFEAMPESRYERLEGLEQLRLHAPLERPLFDCL